MDQLARDFEQKIQQFRFEHDLPATSSEINYREEDVEVTKDPRSFWRELTKEEMTEQKLLQRCSPENLSEVSIDQQLFLGLAMSKKDVVYHRRKLQMNFTGESLWKCRLNDYDGVFDLKVKGGTWADLVISTTGYDPIRIKFVARPDQQGESSDGKISHQLVLEECNRDNPLFISAALRNRYFIETNGSEIEFTGFRYQNDVRRQIDKLNPMASVSVFETGQVIEIGLFTEPRTYMIDQ